MKFQYPDDWINFQIWLENNLQLLLKLGIWKIDFTCKSLLYNWCYHQTNHEINKKLNGHLDEKKQFPWNILEIKTDLSLFWMHFISLLHCFIYWQSIMNWTKPKVLILRWFCKIQFVSMNMQVEASIQRSWQWKTLYWM